MRTQARAEPREQAVTALPPGAIAPLAFDADERRFIGGSKNPRIIHLHKLRSSAVKYIFSGLLVLGLLAVQVSEANAAACAAGVYHAGCVGPRGAVVTGRPATVVHRGAVVAPHCYYRAGVRVCR